MTQSLKQRLAAVLTGLVALGLTACGGGATVKGRVSDGAGTQAQSQVRAQGTLGGSGTVAAAAKVRVSVVGRGAGLVEQGEADVGADGRYELSVPAEHERLLLQAVDASGNVVASALLDSSGAAGETVMAPPMDTESSVEALVFERMVTSGAEPSSVNTVDLRARIDARMAAEIRQGGTDGISRWARELGMSVRAAQEAEVRAYAEAGVQTSQAALFEAELAAAAKLNAALDAGGDAAQAYETFYADLAAAAQKVGAEAHEHAQAESSASAAFRVYAEAELSDAAPLVDAAVRAAAALEARSSGAALTALLQAAGAADATKAQAAEAAAQLRAQVDAAGSASAAAQAFAGFSSTVATGASVQATVLGSFLGVNLTNAAGVNLAVQSATTAGAALDGALDITLSTATNSAGVTDMTTVATGTAEAYGSFATGLRNQASVLSAFGSKSTPAMELLIVAEGSFRAGR